MITHRFQQSLAKSHKAEDLPFWEVVYRKAFPGFVAMHNHRQDGEHQRAGIDRSVILENSKQILVDEKTRWEDYGDIFLEYYSDFEKASPGWVCKPLRADYIAYAIAPTGRCYLLPVPQLQMAWTINSDQWLGKFRYRDVPNESWDGSRYTTRGCPVPVNEVFQKIGACLRISFEPITKESSL